MWNVITFNCYGKVYVEATIQGGDTSLFMTSQSEEGGRRENE